MADAKGEFKDILTALFLMSGKQRFAIEFGTGWSGFVPIPEDVAALDSRLRVDRTGERPCWRAEVGEIADGVPQPLSNDFLADVAKAEAEKLLDGVGLIQTDGPLPFRAALPLELSPHPSSRDRRFSI